MKLFAIGLWVTLVALAAAYAAAVYLPAMTAQAKAPPPVIITYAKSRVLNVPMIARGVVQGYIALQLGMSVDSARAKDASVPPDVYLLDEAFRTIYADNTIDMKNLAKYDLGRFTAHLRANANDRLGGPVIKEVLIEQFSYIAPGSGKG